MFSPRNCLADVTPLFESMSHFLLLFHKNFQFHKKVPADNVFHEARNLSMCLKERQSISNDTEHMKYGRISMWPSMVLPTCLSNLGEVQYARKSTRLSSSTPCRPTKRKDVAVRDSNNCQQDQSLKPEN